MRIGIIGLGSIGTRRAKIVKAMRRHEVYGVEPNFEARQRIHALSFGLSIFDNVEMLWDQKPDAVLICTPPESHMNLVWAAIEHDCPVFVEKPLSDCRVIFVPTTKQLTGNTWVNMAACNWRFHQGPATIKRWLDEGVIGEVISARLWHGSYLPDWVPDRDYKTSYAAKTGVILDVGSHLVDLATWLLGPAVLKSAASRPATSIGLDCDGTAELLLAHKSGAISSVGMSFEQRAYEMGCQIVGSKGKLEWEKGPDWFAEWTGEDGGSREYVSLTSTSSDRMYLDEMAHFLDCVRDSTPTCNPVSEAARTLNILLEAKNK